MRKEKISLILGSLLLLSGLLVGIILVQYPQVLQKFAAEQSSFLPLLEIPKTEDYLPNEVIVGYKESVSSAQTQTLMQDAQVLSLTPLSAKDESSILENTYLIKLSEGVSAVEKANEFSKNPAISFAEPNFIFKPQLVPNDPDFPNQWGLKKINTESAWDLSTGQNQVRVAVLDTGIDRNHPDLSETVSGDTQIISDHGTKVAGAIGALTDNNQGIAALGFNKVQLDSIVICESATRCSAALVAQGINQALINNDKILVLAIGSETDSTLVRTAIQQASFQNVLIIAAAGNDGTTEYRYPAAYPQVLSVAASSQNDSRASFSQYGDWVDVATPGVFILTTISGGYTRVEGTSIAASITASLASLIWSTKPNLSSYQVQNTIQSSSDQVSFVRHGRINAEKALAQIVSSPTPTTTPAATPTPQTTPPLIPLPTGPTPTSGLPFFQPAAGCEGINPLTDPYCALMELPRLLYLVITTMSPFAALVCLFFLFVGGFKYITAGSDPKSLESARKTLVWAVIGLIIASSAYFLVKFFAGLGGGLGIFG